MAHLNPSTAPADLSGYFVVNVTGHRGYSFGVKSPGATEDEVIDLALSAGLFDDEKDSDYAFASPMTDYDYPFFKNNIKILS